MNTHNKIRILSSFVLLVLILSMIFPSYSVLADDTVPPAEETEESAPPTEDAEEPVAPSEKTQEPVAPQEAPQLEEFPIESPVDDPQPELQEVDLETLSDEPAPELQVVDLEALKEESSETSAEAEPLPQVTAAEETAVEDDFAEVVTEAAEKDIVLTNGEGEPLQMAAAESAEQLAGADPYFSVGGTVYGYSSTGTCPPIVNVCTADPNPLQAAITAAPDGSTVFVEPGDYHESILINKALVLSGNVGDPNVAGAAYNAPKIIGSGGTGITITSSNVTLQGFIITGFEIGLSLQGPVNPPSLSNLLIRNNTFVNNTLFDIEGKGNVNNPDIELNVFMDVDANGNPVLPVGYALYKSPETGQFSMPNNYWGCDGDNCGPVGYIQTIEKDTSSNSIIGVELHNDDQKYEKGTIPAPGANTYRQGIVNGFATREPNTIKIKLDPILSTLEPGCPDSDGDGVCDDVDQCPGSDDNIDNDNDGVPDGCDKCQGSDDSIDTDADGVPDGCDKCEGSNDNIDADADGVPDGCDKCEGSDDSVDTDADGVPDGCDKCEGSDDTIDADNDGVPDDCDNCPEVSNPGQEDTDGDGIGDACEVPCTDSDGDGVCDDVDKCQSSDDNIDTDADGVPDGCDKCEGSDDTIDTDADGVPDGCDKCEGSDDSVDTDADGVPDGCDKCRGSDDAIDADNDGVPDGCDKCEGSDDTIDTDADGVPDGCDKCEGSDDTIDTDADGVPDGCDKCEGSDDTIDTDADGVPDGCDKCQGSDDSVDADADGVPDGCDKCEGSDDGIDTDNDGVPDDCDNCSNVSNPNQEDSDENGVGDACEEIIQPYCGDGVVNQTSEACDGTDGVGQNQACSEACTLIDLPYCGDNSLDEGEACDDGNNIDGDGCSATCTEEPPAPFCGDNNLDEGEECDDGNLTVNDGCSAICTIEEPICGNEVVEEGEACDDGNTLDGDGCSAICTVEILGCTDPKATNYKPNAIVEDGSCEYPPVFGCTDPFALNYDRSAIMDDGSCRYPLIPPQPPIRLNAIIPVTGGETHAIAAGIAHTCALTPIGGVQCWGNNDHGQLGDGTNNASNVRVDVKGLSGGTTIVAGGNHTCLLAGGDVWCWGQNASGQIGDGTTTDRNIPVKVLTGAVDITAGYDYTCAMLTNGQVLCWGNNDNGQITAGKDASYASPTLAKLVSGLSQVDAGRNTNCGLTSTGLIRCADGGNLKELGNSPSNLNVAVNRFDSTVIALNDQGVPVQFLLGESRLISQLSGVQDIDSGYGHVCALEKSGSVKCWGANNYGQLGNNLTTRSSEPVSVNGLPSAWQLAVGMNHTCVMTTLSTLTDPEIMCWGLNKDGQLGDGTNENSLVPVKVK